MGCFFGLMPSRYELLSIPMRSIRQVCLKTTVVAGKKDEKIPLMPMSIKPMHPAPQRVEV